LRPGSNNAPCPDRSLPTAPGPPLTTAAALLAELSGRHIGADITTSKVTGFVLFVVLNVLMGVAFGALLHNTAAAIVLFFALPAAFTAASTALKSTANGSIRR
jgi:hypothetical protein